MLQSNNLFKNFDIAVSAASKAKEKGKFEQIGDVQFIFRTTNNGVVEKRSNCPPEDSKVAHNSGNNVSNRLLAIIRNEPTKQRQQQQQQNSDDFLYYVDKDLSTNKLNTDDNSNNNKNIDSARLNAKDLNEWLNLARNKSTSESNLDILMDRQFNQSTNRNNMNRRASLPFEYYERQMHYILEKEKEIQCELERLENERRKLTAEMATTPPPPQTTTTHRFQAEDFHISRKGDFAENRTKSRPISMPISTEVFRQQMYEEYMDKVAAREERKQLKVIKVTSTSDVNQITEIKQLGGIEDEFMDKVKEKQKLGKLQVDDEDDPIKTGITTNKQIHEDRSDNDEPVLVIDGDSLKGTNNLPKHLLEFVDITKLAAENNCENSSDGVWSPGQNKEFQLHASSQDNNKNNKDEPITPVWQPKSATSSPTVERKEFRPVKFASPVLNRKTYTKSEDSINPENYPKEAVWRTSSSGAGVESSGTLQKHLPTSHSSPVSGFNDFSTSRLPKAQNPTITLLQKAREGQLPKGASYIEQEPNYRRPISERPSVLNPGEIRHQMRSEYTSESDSERPRRMADLNARKVDGIGPMSKDGMPLILRSEVKDANQSKWYKRMYDTIHKQRPHRDEYVTVRYKQKRAQYPYMSGYLSEPEPGAYDSDFSDYRYATLDRRRLPNKENEFTMSSTIPRTTETKSSSDLIKHDPYKNPPGRIEHYTPGHSSISEKEAKEWWDEVMDIFDGHLEQQKRAPQPKSFINQALKESGYESDSTLVFKRRDDAAAQQLSPLEQKEVYKVIQKGGDIPLHGLRKPAPERPKEEAHMEFIPISPTLTRIRVHRQNVQPPKEIICYPVTIHPHPSTIFAKYKRTAPSSNPVLPPSPPKRRSSRNNSTLRLISTMKVKTDKLPSCSRHETCFTTTSNIDNTNVKYLRDKITCKLSPNTKTKETKPKLKISKTITTTPDLKSKVTSTISTSKSSKSSISRVHSRTNITNSKLHDKCSCKSHPERCRKCAKKVSTKGDAISTKDRTFGTEKRKVDLVLPKPQKRYTLINSPELLSPTEVKKVVETQRHPPSGTVFKKSNAVLASAKNSSNPDVKNRSIPIKVGITEKGKAILHSSTHRPSTNNTVKLRHKSLSPIPPMFSGKVSKNLSLESLKAPTTATTKKIISTVGRCYSAPATPKTVRQVKMKETESKKLKKSKKEQINGEIAKKHKQVNEIIFDKSTKCAGRAAGTEIIKKLKEMADGESDEFGSNSTLSEIQKQQDLVKTDCFFQHLFLRDTASPTPSMASRHSWLLEKAHQFHHRKPSYLEPSISAMKVYLKHTRPVTDSKFKSFDLAQIRSRSASPKPVTDSGRHSEKRSSSLPPKLIFSQTSRPVSPKIERKSIRTPTPPQSPKVLRSPSSRRIMHFKNSHQVVEGFYGSNTRESPTTSRTDLSLYSCPSIARSSSSIDSYDRKEYQDYIKELLRTSRKSDKFRDLNEFYSKIEKCGKLEQVASFINLKPRRRYEEEIIDYDRWREVRTREKAERELQSLVVQLKEGSKEKGFLFAPKQIDKYRWKRELDRGLRAKEKSVENIREQFEKIKVDEDRKQLQLNYLKDTYKPLWRGDSVVSLANRMTERRSHSEGRVTAAKQKLLQSERMLTHGIGSRLWSSLSMEQVNLLKNQLSEIYSQNLLHQKKQTTTTDVAIQVPVDIKHHPSLKVRRNSDTTEITETDKKVLSQTLSKEALGRVAAKKKGELTLSLVLPKETLGAVAAAEAKLEYRQNGNRAGLEHIDASKPKEALIKTDATSSKLNSITSETESGSTDESTKTVIYAGDKGDIKKKVEYFETASEKDQYTPIIYKAADNQCDIGEAPSPVQEIQENFAKQSKPVTSQSCQNLKELFGEQEMKKTTTISTRLRTPSPPISETTSIDSFQRSRSLSPYYDEPLALVKAGEVHRLKKQFEHTTGTYPPKSKFRPRRWRSDPTLTKPKTIEFPGLSFGDVDSLRSRYEYPAHAGRGRSRIRRGGVVSPTFLRAEDRFMPHINIISKIAALYSHKPITKEKSQSMEELANILGCPLGEVEKMRQKFDENLSILGHMFTSSPNMKELRDINQYLAASWIAHRYPRTEDNTRSLSSPECSTGTRDVSLLRKDRLRPKSASPTPKTSPILKNHLKQLSMGQRGQMPKHQPEGVRYKSSWTSSTHTRPSVSFQEPEPPVPPPKGHHGVRNREPESPRKYVEDEVTIHYRTPVRHEIKEYLSEDELAHRQAEAMKKIYEEERRRKYLQELQDMNSRRHTDNFIPSQKSPIPLNRYDDFDDLAPPPAIKPRPRSPERRLMAKALYNFVGQTARELTFRKGDLIYVRRQVDKNWYEGELNAMVGLFPVNYVEIVTYDPSRITPRKPHEGQARAKFNFVAQTHLELSLAKGELVVLTRRVDDNWYEGKIGGRKGIFPVSYVDILIDPNDQILVAPISTKPVAAPAAHSLLLNGSAGGKESMGSHSYTPSLPNSNQLTTTTTTSSSYHAKPVQLSNGGSYGSLKGHHIIRSPVNQALHIETQSEPVPYRAMYKYLPQNDDELELLEGDTVYVLEKCDDGWYVGSSERTGAFGTFPGNYVEKI